MNKRYKLWEVGRQLTATAQGKQKADLVIKNGKLVNVFTGEILPNTDVAVTFGRVALVGDATMTIGEKTVIIDAQGMYLVPGFIDGHLHVESSLMTVGEYAKSTIPHGTSSIFMDPHEIVNVAGLDGMVAMMKDGAATPLRVFTTIPSCVPASPGLENTGSTITPQDIQNTMNLEGVVGLGEMMSYTGILCGDPQTCEKVEKTLEAGKTVTGHFPLTDTGATLNAYIASGINCCHESTSAREALAKMRLGMYAMIREGSAWDDLPEVIKAITEHEIDTRLALLVSDDLHADTIIKRGHMDYIIRLAVSMGVRPVTAIQMATLNTACCFGMERDIGSISPGRFADINILSDLGQVRVEKVIINGELVAEKGSLIVPVGGYEYPEQLKTSVKITRIFLPDDFIVKAPLGAETARVRVIGVHDSNVLTTEIVEALPVRNGEVELATEKDICKVAVINRHKPDGGISVGFVHGFGLKKGAVASTYAHDAHNLIVLGLNDVDMAFAVNTLVECSGGMTAVQGEKVLALLKMPIAGLMSDLSAQEVANALGELSDAWAALGSPLASPFMTMSLMSLVVIPEIRITDKGLINVYNNSFTTLFVD
ncbi:adenine deaminase [Desulfosporosinus sp. Sb-LF]|uniref:adenine deaminase n=1 Tax=Desulfosporosinus sp. Sb-LF TaxID=2560027 RepID=UPI00107F25DC|nr:adenine deaminase [Desulfosporosinus sp. Sb-LF]TGE33294.1 adenine deaminase [Desulfosporosinus sp. Sb-LF]